MAVQPWMTGARVRGSLYREWKNLLTLTLQTLAFLEEKSKGNPKRSIFAKPLTSLEKKGKQTKKIKANWKMKKAIGNREKKTRVGGSALTAVILL